MLSLHISAHPKKTKCNVGSGAVAEVVRERRWFDLQFPKSPCRCILEQDTRYWLPTAPQENQFCYVVLCVLCVLCHCM